MLPVIVSYYTKNSLYEKQVRDLVASCKALCLEYDIEAIDSFGSWSKNCCYKPAFILKKMLEHRRPIVWTDADSVIIKTPKLFKTLDSDFALHVREHLPQDDFSKVLSGTLFINYSTKAKIFVKLWLLESLKSSTDQEALRDTIIKYPNIANIFHLPSSYCHIFDKQEDLDAVFVHYQASRAQREIEKGNWLLDAFLNELEGEEFKTFRRTEKEDI